MRYTEFRDAIQEELGRYPNGLTWPQLKDRLGLPYDRPCAQWVARMEEEIGLSRAKDFDRAYLWKIRTPK